MGIVDAINKIPTYLGIDKVTDVVGSWLDRHPVVNKIVMVVNHVFRTIAMIALMYVLPFTPIVNLAIGLAASLFYRITVERFCPFRFALSACVGAAAYELSKPFLIDLISGVAFKSILAFAATFIGLLPLVISAVIVISLSNDSVDRKYAQTNQPDCCTVPPKNRCCSSM